ncbi:hypothetical protein [Arthrobacter agilis]|uniref:hypothetical protein n=1 Tax=Arthrobacter agilis TaxID=37921 RepID=UPI00278A8C37|nr:hypothetical protein [Arthrobacter agilis]MDQ0736540.1 AcrR family transcriptional regulator [Arthrobacter agilis]
MTSAGPGRPRARPSVRRRSTGHEEILGAAAEPLTGHGDATTSTRAVIGAAGICPSSLHRRFTAR